MTANHGEATAPGAGYLVTRPPWFIRAVMGPMTKVLNPVMLKLAGRRHVPMAALIGHTGRKSGRRYQTPAGAHLTGDTFVIPLTFGTGSDWSRNVRAAGGCSIRLNGVDYTAVGPEVVSAADARPVLRSAFSPVERGMFRRLGIKSYLLLRRAAD